MFAATWLNVCMESLSLCLLATFHSSSLRPLPFRGVFHYLPCQVHVTVLFGTSPVQRVRKDLEPCLAVSTCAQPAIIAYMAQCCAPIAARRLLTVAKTGQPANSGIPGWWPNAWWTFFVGFHMTSKHVLGGYFFLRPGIHLFSPARPVQLADVFFIQVFAKMGLQFSGLEESRAREARPDIYNIIYIYIYCVAI